MSDFQGENTLKHVDVFKEIGNIGAGNAASALADLLGRQITMSVPEASVVNFNAIADVMAGPEELVAGVLIDFTGDMIGYVLLMLKIDDAMSMVSGVLKQQQRRLTVHNNSLTDIESDALLEISNILVGSFLSSISTFTGLNVKPSVPQIAIDMLGAIISIATIEYGKIGDSVLLLKTQFCYTDNESAGHFFLIPDYSSYKKLLNSIGLDS